RGPGCSRGSRGRAGRCRRRWPAAGPVRRPAGTPARPRPRRVGTPSRGRLPGPATPTRGGSRRRGPPPPPAGGPRPGRGFPAGRAVDVPGLVARHPELADALAGLNQLVGEQTTRIDGALPERALSLPVQIGPYQIERELGAGGFGVVYLARDPDVRRFVALK